MDMTRIEELKTYIEKLTLEHQKAVGQAENLGREILTLVGMISERELFEKEQKNGSDTPTKSSAPAVTKVA
jgi:hypothetical protein